MLDHARRFISLAVPSPTAGEAYLNIHWSSIGPEGQKYWDGRATESVDDAIRTISWVNSMGPNHDLYVCMSTQARFEDKTSKKGKQYRKAIRFQEDVKGIQSLFIDVDVKAGAYATQGEALAALQAFMAAVGLPMPSAVVASGSGGFHVHWVVDEVLSRDEWQLLANSLCAATIKHGLKTDTQCTIDSARILRIPDTFNYKSGEAKPVTLLSIGEKVTTQVMRGALAGYDIGTARPASPFEQPGATTAEAGSNSDLTAGIEKVKIEYPVAEIAKNCGFVRRSLGTGGKDNPNPLWFLTASIANFTSEGREALHMMSSQHPGYSAVDTDRLFDRIQATQAKKDLGWPKCQKIAGYGAPECQTCPLLKHVKSPLSFVIKVGAQISPDLTMPDKYTRDSNGIIMARGIADDGTPIVIPIIHYPVFSGWMSDDPWTLHIISRLSGTRKVTVDVPLDVIVGGKDTFAKFLGSKGFSCTDSQFKLLKDFFVSWVQKLQNAKDSVISAAPFGWAMDNGAAEGFAYGGRVWMDGSDRPAANPSPVLSYQYTPKGDIAIWREAVKVIYSQRRPALDAILAVAFAGPLVKFTGHAGLILNAYSPESGIGKTTAMKVSQAVWGHPVMAMQSLNDTANSVMGKMGQTRSLPVYWDELKSDQQIRQFCSIIFTMTGGREKTRMNQDAQLRMSGEWHTLLVSASNDSLVDGMAREAGSTTAGLHRMFEYIVPPGKSSALEVGMVQRLIGKLEDNYGHAGLLYSKFLGTHSVRVDREVAEMNDKLLSEVTARNEERVWVATMAVVLKGAEYSNELGLTDIDM